MLGVTRAKASKRGAIRRALRLLSAFVPAFAIAIGQPMAQPALVAADAPGCATTTASAYTVQLCFAQSLVGATLSGNAAIQASLTVQSGSYSVRWLVYTIDGAPLLNDYRAPYSFTLPTAQWADGLHTLAVYAESLVAGNPCCTTSSASVAVTFANGQLVAPTNTSQPTISLGTSPAPGSPEIVAAAGDGASGESTATDVANLISSWSPNLFLYLGDVYFQGTYTEFANWYDGTFGRFRAISDPTIGNHEYLTPNGAGYFNYWNNEPHYYSYDAAGWHFISLDANQPAMSAAAWNNQLSWLQTDLSAHAGACTLAYWHQPLFNIGQEGPAPQTQAFWSALSAAHASIVLNGHDHNYQRWQPMDASGNVSASGVTEFVAGTAGHGTTPFITTDTRMAAGTAAVTSIGALKLSLSPASAAFQFVQSNGTVFDSGTVRCQGSGTLAGTVTDVQSSHPLAGAVVTYDGSASGLGSGSATTDGSGHYSVAALAAGTYAVSVSATGEAPQTAAVTVGGAATSVHDFGLTGNPGRITGTVTDSNTGATVAGATVSYSGGSTTTDATGSYTLAGVPPGSYTVTANAAGYGAATHAAAVVGGGTTTQNLALSPVPFTDDFESGGVSHWTTNTGLVPEQSTVHAGVWALEGNATNGQTFASKNLPTNYQSVYYRTYLDLKSNSTNVSLLWDRTAAGIALLHLYVDSTGKLGLRNDITGVATIAPVAISRGTWHSLELHATVNGTSSAIEVWLDGVHVPALESSAANLGSVLVGRVWLGENNIARTYDIAFDDVVIGASYVGPSSGATATIGGVVTDSATGLPITGATVSAGGVTATTGSGGGYSLMGLAAGTFNVTAAAGGFGSATATVVVTSGATASQNFALVPQSGAINGTVTDAVTGAPVSGATASAGAASSTTSASGQYSLLGVGEGAYTLTVTKQGYATASPPVSVGPGATVQKDVSLAPNPGTISGTVTDASTGLPIAGAAVSDGSAGVTTDAAGHYAFSAVTEGTYTVVVSATGLPGQSASVTVGPGSAATHDFALVNRIFTDDFESGGVSHWTTNTGLVPEQSTVHAGVWALEGNATNGQTFASKNLPTNYQSVYYRTYLDLKSNSTNVSLLWDRTAAGIALLHLYVDSTGKLGLRNDITGVATIAPVAISRGTWHSLELHATVNGTSSAIEVWLDGVHVPALESSAANLGSVLVGRVWLGENNIARTYDIAFDDVVIGASYVGP